MYDAVEDPYCYPGTTVLKNKLKLKTQKELDEFEAEITAQRAEEPLPTGKLTYSHYPAIHKHLFQGRLWLGGKNPHGPDFQGRQHVLLPGEY